MSDVRQTISDSKVENMAGRDVNITIIQNATQSFPRSQYIHDILAVRDSCKHLEFIINTHAIKCYHTRFFKEMTDEDLKAMHIFTMQLKQAIEKRNVPSFVAWVMRLFRK